mmetsp:Transcript_170815/g.542788  ORF Transcript_170815/g.542788 Transcript_170815/m.542788 type:complete len:837 (+) Transcript_170815:48-2558(+)
MRMAGSSSEAVAEGDGVADVLVVGAGMIGSATARHLRMLRPDLVVWLVGPEEAGAREAGVFCQHADEARITRRLDPDPVWAALASRSIERYAELEVGYALGTVGPCRVVDTACSASLVAASINHAGLRANDNTLDYNEALSMGIQGMFSPYTFIGLSAAGMLGRGGRCLTFDSTANGYNRGEGVGGLLQKVSDDPEVTQNRLANFCSSFINQDGRSASLTAPNGPSQQAVMRNSMQMEDISFADLTIQENHGTGTALGDPIEVGSVRAVFRKHPTGIPVVSGKTHCGHLEAAAGSLGLIKTILSLLNMTVPPNVHLRELNAHMDISGFPGLFPTECLDLQRDSAMAGANGFGFGGTNCRAELWARCMYGPSAVRQKTLQQRRLKGQPWEIGGRPEVLDAVDCVVEACPRCLGQMCWRCGEASPSAEVKGKHRCQAIRKEFSNYEWCSDCYIGEYQYGSSAPSSASAAPSDEAIYLVGSWSSWTALEEMRRQPDGSYKAEVRLGDCGFEQFHLAVGEDRDQAIVPAVSKAGQDARIVGPLQVWRSQNWLIDGRADGAPVGTMYEICFRWEDRSKSIFWRRLPRRSRLPPRLAPEGRGGFFVAGSLTEWKPVAMQRCAGDPGAWEFMGQIGAGSEETFHFLLDGDPGQMIYPLVDTSDDPSVPVVGPGPGDGGRGWKVHGPQFSIVDVRLRARDGVLTVEVKGQDGKTKVWRSDAQSSRDVLQVVGSFCGWDAVSAEELLPVVDPSGRGTGRLVGHFHIGEMGREEFQILVNGNVSQALCPAALSTPGRGFLCGPQPAEGAASWEIQGFPGQMVEVIFDENAEDHHRIVTCRMLDDIE